MTDAWVVREFKFPDDYEACANLWKNAGGGVKFCPSDTYAEIQKKVGYAPDLFLVAEQAGQIIATVIGGFDGRRGMVYHLAVDAAWRGCGLAGQLMAEIESRLVARGCKKMYLMINPEHPELVDFYSKLGWNKMDVIIAAKEINYR